jgi:hypothetical protein
MLMSMLTVDIPRAVVDHQIPGEHAWCITILQTLSANLFGLLLHIADELF